MGLLDHRSLVLVTLLSLLWQSDVQSVEAAKIQKAWETRVERFRKTSTISKDYIAREFEILGELLRSTPAGVIDSELERLIHSDKAYDQMSAYEEKFIDFHIDKYETEGNWDKMVYILGNKCPRNVGYVSLELGITNGKKPENLSVLFDSYDKATDQQSKQRLLSVLSSVFADLRKQYANDLEFLAASRRWLLANQATLKINTAYSPFAMDSQRRKFFVH